VGRESESERGAEKRTTGGLSEKEKSRLGIFREWESVELRRQKRKSCEKRKCGYTQLTMSRGTGAGGRTMGKRSGS